jgi:hypothetical protein
MFIWRGIFERWFPAQKHKLFFVRSIGNDISYYLRKTRAHMLLKAPKLKRRVFGAKTQNIGRNLKEGFETIPEIENRLFFVAIVSHFIISESSHLKIWDFG